MSGVVSSVGMAAFTDKLTAWDAASRRVFATASKSIVRAFREALSLAVSSSYLTPETAPLILGKAQAQAQALASKLGVEPI
jgi:hypothetical protein